MADTVSSKILMDGARNAVVKLTSISDGTGETAVVKVNPLDFSPVPQGFRINEITYDLSAMQAELFWEGTPNVLIATISAGQGTLNFERIGGLQPTGAGLTGKILLTTLSAGSGDTYSIVLNMKKKM